MGYSHRASPDTAVAILAPYLHQLASCLLFPSIAPLLTEGHDLSTIELTIQLQD